MTNKDSGNRGNAETAPTRKVQLVAWVSEEERRRIAYAARLNQRSSSSWLRILALAAAEQTLKEAA